MVGLDKFKEAFAEFSENYMAYVIYIIWYRYIQTGIISVPLKQNIPIVV